MNAEIVSSNPAAKAIITGVAPAQARMAAARGILPLPQADLLEILVFLVKDEDSALAAAARETLAAQNDENLLNTIKSAEIAPRVLTYLAENAGFDRRIYEAVITHEKTPDESIINLAANLKDSNLIELITVNQQRLIRKPEILDAILANPARSHEAERRAKEVRIEFFEKSRGAQQIAEELRARGQEAAAEFIEQAEFSESLVETETEGQISVEDALFLSQFIEVPDDEVDDSWLDFDHIEELYEETEEQRRALAEKIISESTIDGDAAPERIALIRKIMLMGIKDRVKLAMKGDREARSILIRDPNKIVASGVLANARITEQEVEKISSMRTVPDEILRSIGNNRTYARNYLIIHSLVRNPRTPLPTAMTILPRIQTTDLRALANNRNVSEAIRKQAARLLATRR